MTEENQDEYGRAFVALLHDQARRPSRSDLAGLTVRKARAVYRRRRRRRAAALAVAGAAALTSLVAVAVTVSHDRTAQPATPTAAIPMATRTPAVPPSNAPTPRTVTINAALKGLGVGDPTGIQWVQDGTWHQRDGRVVPIGLDKDTDQGLQAFSLGDQLFVTGSTPSGHRTTVIVSPDGTSRQVSEDGHAFTRGPAGSLLWLEARASQTTLVRLGSDQAYRRYPVPIPAASITDASLVATRESVFISTDDTVTRLAFDESGVHDPQRVAGAEQAVTSDPDGDSVVLADDDLCTSVIPSTESKPNARQCRYRTTAVSGSGQYRYGYDIDSEDGVVTDSAGHTLMILKNARSPEAVFDDSGRLQIAGAAAGPNDETTTVGVVTCDLPLTCARLGRSSNVLVNSGEDPILLIR